MISSAIINHVVVKHWNDETGVYDINHTVDNMVFATFIEYLDNISTIATVNWSVDFLNLGYTRATVYVDY